jgi:hypothetical protein
MVVYNIGLQGAQLYPVQELHPELWAAQTDRQIISSCTAYWPRTAKRSNDLWGEWQCPAWTKVLENLQFGQQILLTCERQGGTRSWGPKSNPGSVVKENHQIQSEAESSRSPSIYSSSDTNKPALRLLYIVLSEEEQVYHINGGKSQDFNSEPTPVCPAECEPSIPDLSIVYVCHSMCLLTLFMSFLLSSQGD